MKQHLRRFRKDQHGATAIEYGLIAGLIAVIIIAAVGQVGGALNDKFNNISASIN